MFLTRMAMLSPVFLFTFRIQGVSHLESSFSQINPFQSTVHSDLVQSPATPGKDSPSSLSSRFIIVHRRGGGCNGATSATANFTTLGMRRVTYCPRQAPKNSKGRDNTINANEFGFCLNMATSIPIMEMHNRGQNSDSSSHSLPSRE
jgi:hypothetical protein